MLLELVVIASQDGYHVVIPRDYVLISGGFECVAAEFILPGLILLQQITKVLGNLWVDVNNTFLVARKVFLQCHELVRISLDLALHMGNASVVDRLLEEKWLYVIEHIGWIFPVLVCAVGLGQVRDASVEQQGGARDAHVVRQQYVRQALHVRVTHHFLHCIDLLHFHRLLELRSLLLQSHQLLQVFLCRVGISRIAQICHHGIFIHFRQISHHLPPIGGSALQVIIASCHHLEADSRQSGLLPLPHAPHDHHSLPLVEHAAYVLPAGAPSEGVLHACQTVLLVRLLGLCRVLLLAHI